MTAKTCPATHTTHPDGLAWYGWVEGKMRTHYQEQCPACGLWAIYKRRSRPLRKEQLDALLYGADDVHDLDNLLDDRLAENEKANLLDYFEVEA